MSIEPVTNNITNDASASSVSAVYKKTEPYPNDSLELSTKYNNLSKKKKASLYAASSTAFLACTSFVFLKYQKNRILNLYKKKLVISNLPEKLEFKPAKTLEEAMKYTKDVLGIKEVDKNFTLEALNIANKGITDVSNAQKGKLFLPTKLRFEKKKKDSVIASVDNNIYYDTFGNLVINKSYFDESFLDKSIQNFLFSKDNKNKIYSNHEATGKLRAQYRWGCVYPELKTDLEKLVKRFYQDKSSLSIDEKQVLYYSLLNAFTNASRSQRTPFETLKEIIANKRYLSILKRNNFQTDLEKIKSMSYKEKQKYLTNIIKTLEKNNIYFNEYYGITSPAYSIYHEMGHLQDFAKNLKELDVMKWDIKFSKLWGKRGKYGEYRFGVREIENRWGANAKDKYRKMFENQPNRFKNRYPDLYEFLTNEESKVAAGKVSSYAQSGIGEFIAETYAAMIEKKSIPDDVMALYRKYRGPEF